MPFDYVSDTRYQMHIVVFAKRNMHMNSAVGGSYNYQMPKEVDFTMPVEIRAQDPAFLVPSVPVKFLDHIGLHEEFNLTMQ